MLNFLLKLKKYTKWSMGPNNQRSLTWQRGKKLNVKCSDSDPEVESEQPATSVAESTNVLELEQPVTALDEPNTDLATFSKSGLTKEKVIFLLNNRAVPQTKNDCPKDGSGRRIGVEYFKAYNWLSMSKILNEIYCLPCFFLLRKRQLQAADQFQGHKVLII